MFLQALATCLADYRQLLQAASDATPPCRYIEKSLASGLQLKRVAMDIQFECDKCGQHIVIDETGAGIKVQCPACRQELTVPVDPTAMKIASVATSSLSKRGEPMDVSL